MKEIDEIKNFFYPKVIAIIGASNNPQKVGNVLIEKLKKFSGKVIPVNIKKELIDGEPAYGSILDYSGKIDLAIIATPAETVPKIVEECGKKKIKNIIVISSGFSEIGNIELEKKLADIAKKYKISLLGPNCFGTEEPYSNLDCTFSNSSTKKGDIAFISQSGALWSYISDLDEKNIGFSGFVSLGNMAMLDFSDFVEYFSQDKKTKKIILYMEKIKDGKKLIEVCRNSKKEIVVIKAGKTEAGKKATVSHTGSLATDYEIYRGAFKQAGIKTADFLADALNIKREDIKIKGKKVMIITNAGGSGALMSDYCEMKKIKIAGINDILGTALAIDYQNALKKAAERNDYDTLIVILTPQKMSQPEETANAIIEFSKQTKKEIIACFLGELSIKKAKEILEKNKIKCLTRVC